MTWDELETWLEEHPRAVSNLPPRTCECTVEFIPSRADQVWCDAACRSRFAMRRMRARRRENA